jgi:hypothetical protein
MTQRSPSSFGATSFQEIWLLWKRSLADINDSAWKHWLSHTTSRAGRVLRYAFAKPMADHAIVARVVCMVPDRSRIDDATGRIIFEGF